MRWLGRSLILLGVAAISSCTTRFWVWNQTLDIPRVPLTSGLTGGVEEASRVFDARVKERFSVGTPMAEVGLELQREGFVRQDWGSLPTEQHNARRYDGGGLFCNRVAWVYWKSDDTDRLASINGSYWDVCL